MSEKITVEQVIQSYWRRCQVTTGRSVEPIPECDCIEFYLMHIECGIESLRKACAATLKTFRPNVVRHPAVTSFTTDGAAS